MTDGVVVTGIGAITPIGATATETWNALCAGDSGASRLTRFDPDGTDLNSRIACEIDALPDPEPPVAGTIEDRAVGRYARLALQATTDALADAGLLEVATNGRFPTDSDRVGTSVGTALGGQPAVEESVGERPSPRLLVASLSNLAAGHVAASVDARGPQRTPATACAAGLDAVATAGRHVAAGRADVMLAGGTEASISPVAMGSFDAMRALSTRNDEPAAAPRPFDADRDGFVLGEGAAMLVLEAADHAADRGVDPLASVTGAASTADAHHPTRPPEDGTGLQRCIRRALSAADRSPGDVDHVNAHGTATPVGDRREATALNAVFETVPPVTSLKGHLGHTLGAAGAIEAAMLVRSVAAGTLPPTLNYQTPDPDCALPVVDAPRSESIDVALSTAAGFGGVNGALVMEGAR
jgi:3-oxoacyl-[acyl-carrier-protein] synthase II